MRLVVLTVLLLISTEAFAKRYKCDKKYLCGCGSSNVEISTRIINGEQAIPCSWSMVISLRYELSRRDHSIVHACGGTIITESYILTAASCVEGINEDEIFANLSVAAGVHHQSKPIPIIRHVDQIIIHENWTGSWNSYEDDIALLHLSAPLDLQNDSCISQTCLPQHLNISEELLQYPSNGKDLVIAGWGSALSDGKDSDYLKQAIVVSLDLNSTKCKNMARNPEKQFCASLREDVIGSCDGDFGGPIFHWIDNRWEQLGIASFTSGSCKTPSAVIYTRVAYYRDWIAKHVKATQTNEGQIVTTATSAISTTHAPLLTYECDKTLVECGCGRRSVQLPQSNLPTNNEAVPYSWSMIVSIRLNSTNSHSCSGSIITESYILTSASCIANVPTFGINISAGIHSLSDDTMTSRKIDQIFLHPDYIGQSDNYANNIAILHTSRPLDLDGNIFISPVCLPEKQKLLPNPIYYPRPGANLAVTGWGSLNCRNYSDQRVLQQIQVVSMNDTVKSCYINDNNRHIQFCAGVEESDTVPCAGDPGSPIFEWWVDRWEQVGITSHILDCPPYRSSVIYTRVVEYKDWIQSIINNCSRESSSQANTTTSTMSTVTITNASLIPVTTKAPVLYKCNTTLTCGCGAIPVQLTPSRIVGGEYARESSWPMMVSLRLIDDNMHHCGGTILSNSYILTAAHCLYGYVSNPPIGLTAIVGMTNLSDPRQIRRSVDHIYIYPRYIGRQNNYQHDIAVIHLNESLFIENNQILTRTCLHPLNPSVLSSDYITPNTRLTVIGWGRTNMHYPQLSRVLKQVEVLAINNTDPTCQAAVSEVDIQFCAGLPEGGKDSCSGDSGGPIFQWTGQYWEQVGIVSHGQGCAVAGYPGIYTRLSYYYDWISEILNTTDQHLEPQSPIYAPIQEIQTSTNVYSFGPHTNTMINTTTMRAINYARNHQENILAIGVLLFLLLLTHSTGDE